MRIKRRLLAALITLSLLACPVAARIQQVAATAYKAPRPGFEYLWYEAENSRGVSRDARNEPVINPSWQNRTRAEAPGWGINGPGVSAEWTQGGESEWNSVAASADETSATIYQDLEVPREGEYRLWVRYADWAGRKENFVARVRQNGADVASHEFGRGDVIARDDEVSSYWGWGFAWESSAPIKLQKGAARVSLVIEKAADARRHLDCFVLTNDSSYVPRGRTKPPFAGWRVLEEWGAHKTSLATLANYEGASATAPASWRRPLLAGRDFLMPWNISETFWEQYDRPPAERLLYPFHASPIEAFIERYKGAREVPIFDSKFVVPVVYVNELPNHLKEGSAFLRYLRETKSPFAVLINYGNAKFPESEGQEALKLLNGELSRQFLGWISGESIGYVWEEVAANLKLRPETSRREMLEAYRVAYSNALEKKWAAVFQGPAGAMWDRLIPAQSTSSTTYAHPLGEWGVKLLGMETAAVQPMTAMRIAFTRGAARQHGGAFLYYHAPNFGDTATTFTEQQNFAGPAHFYHTRYGATMGPSLAWYRKSYYLYYMAGASATYLEQGYDQFFKPGPGEHPFQLNPLGRVTEEFMRFAERHPDRGTPYTPVAFLLDPAHGFEMTDWPHLPFGVSEISRGDRALRELFGAAYYPGLVNEGEPATADRQAFVNGIFGDVFDVLTASDKRPDAINAYRAVVVGGRVEWSKPWGERLRNYALNGGTVVLNAAQADGLPADLLGVRRLGAAAEADTAECTTKEEPRTDLSGQVFRYERVEPRGTEVLMRTGTGDPLVTVNAIGKGRVIFCAIPDLLGLDERLAPAAAHLLTHLFADASPVRVDGDVEYLVNRNERGWVVTLMNNRGVYKPQQGLAQVNREEKVTARLELRGRGVAGAVEWRTDQKLAVAVEGGRDVLTVEVPPGGILVIELLPRP